MRSSENTITAVAIDCDNILDARNQANVRREEPRGGKAGRQC